MSEQINKLKSKSLTIRLLESVLVHNGEQQSSENKLNLYRMTCDTSGKRDSLVDALKDLK